MAKPTSHVAQEAQEAKRRARDLERQIKQLSTQISNPQKYFAKKPDERTQSTAERFRRYLMADRAAAKIQKRKPTRAEMRAQRNRVIVWSVFALLTVIWIIGKVLQTLQTKPISSP